MSEESVGVWGGRKVGEVGVGGRWDRQQQYFPAKSVAPTMNATMYDNCLSVCVCVCARAAAQPLLLTPHPRIPHKGGTSPHSSVAR